MAVGGSRTFLRVARAQVPRHNASKYHPESWRIASQSGYDRYLDDVTRVSASLLSRTSRVGVLYWPEMNRDAVL